MHRHRTLRAFIPVAVSVLVFVASVGGGALAARVILPSLWAYPTASLAVFVAIALGSATGGFLAFAAAATTIDFFVHGYRIRWSDRVRCWYEERACDGTVVGLPITYKSLAAEYNPPCEIYVPSEGTWNDETPGWAHNRRPEIIHRITTCLGAEFGRRVEFVDLRAPAHEGDSPDEASGNGQRNPWAF